ncbi:MAG: 2-isopropylmalate synthase [Chloroflexota bacterium]
MAEKVAIFDTTLRDGEQSPGCSLSFPEKLEIAHQLARLGVDVIEAGFPISSPGDFQAVQTIARQVRGPMITGLGRAVEKDIDAVWEAVKEAEKKQIHIVLSVSDIHIERKLKKSRAEVLAQGIKAVRYAKRYCEEVEYSPEDAGRAEPEYLYETIHEVIKAGATVINIPDTTGYVLPHEWGELIGNVFKNVPNARDAVISVHCHNDLGNAVANSIAAVLNGARRIECTINGIGERAGNASLEEIVMTLKKRMHAYGYYTNVDATQLIQTSRLVSALMSMPVQPNKAIVGANAFAHASGIHQDGVLKDRLNYEIMTPEEVGLVESNIVLTARSGRHAFKHRLEKLGFGLSDQELAKAWERFLDVADKKKEVTDLDLEAIVSDEIRISLESIRLQAVNINTAYPNGMPTASVRLINADGQEMADSAIGTGPVDATYKAINKVVGVPNKLTEFTVQSVTEGIDAVANVTIRLDSQGERFIGRGADTDILIASAQAYVNALNKVVASRKDVRHKAPAGV